MRGAFQQGWFWLSKFIGGVIIEVSAITLNSCLKHYSMGGFFYINYSITVHFCEESLNSPGRKDYPIQERRILNDLASIRSGQWSIHPFQWYQSSPFQNRSLFLPMIWGTIDRNLKVFYNIIYNTDFLVQYSIVYRCGNLKGYLSAHFIFQELLSMVWEANSLTFHSLECNNIDFRQFFSH